MRKLSLILAAVLIVLVFAVPAYALDYESLQDTLFFKAGDKAVLNGVEQEPIQTLIVDNVTLVPLRLISESFNAKVDWDPKTQGVTVTLGENSVKLNIGSKTMRVDNSSNADSSEELAVAPRISNKTTYVPLRAVAVALDKNVYFDPATKITYIYGGGSAMYYNERSWMTNLADMYYAGNPPVYIDSTTVFYVKNGKLWVSTRFSSDMPLNKHEGYHEVGDMGYLIADVMSEPTGAKHIYAIYPDQKITILATGFLGEFVVDAENQYAYFYNVWPSYISDIPQEEGYDGNLYRVKISEATGDKAPNQESLGMPGFIYSYTADYSKVGGKGVFDYKPKDGGLSLQGEYLYANGFEFINDKDRSQASYKKYQIPISGRSHTVYGEAD